MKLKRLITRSCLLLCLAAALNGCGGSTSPSSDISGVAATGAPIANATVTIKGANGKTVTATTDADGNFSVNTPDLELPYALKVDVADPDTGNKKSLYSIATAKGNANINPLTDLEVTNVAANKGKNDASDVYDSLKELKTTIAADREKALADVKKVLNIEKDFVKDVHDAKLDSYLDAVQIIKTKDAAGAVTITIRNSIKEDLVVDAKPHELTKGIKTLNTTIATLATDIEKMKNGAAKEKAPAKNIILIIGDGMHFQHEIALDNYLGDKAVFHTARFPFKGSVATWDVDTYDNYAANLFNREKFAKAILGKIVDPIVGYDPSKGGKRPFNLDPYIVKNPSIADAYFNIGTVAKPNFPATDSASAATALSTGYKTNKGTLAWLPKDATGAYPALDKGKLKTIAEMMREKKGASIGVVSTVPFSHATPAGFVTHNTSRYDYHGITNEILNTTKPDVVIGGGHPNFIVSGYYHNTVAAGGKAFSRYSSVSPGNQYSFDPVTGSRKNTGAAYRFISFAQYTSVKHSSDYVFVERKPNVDGGQALLAAADTIVKGQDRLGRKKLLGLFGGGFGMDDGCFDPPMPTNDGTATVNRTDRNENPWLSQAAEASINVLSQNPKGFFLMIEQGDIDWANHGNDYKWLIGAMYDLNKSVQKVFDMVDKGANGMNWSNTMVLVTSDHGNSYMRIKTPLGKGLLPAQTTAGPYANSYPNGEITYGTSGHTNELVNVYARGNAVSLLKKYEGAWYKGTEIIDNTQIFKAMKEAAGLVDAKTGALAAFVPGALALGFIRMRRRK